MGYDKDDNKDRLLKDYDSILREGSILTTFSGFLFGFLLNISVRPETLSLINRVTLLVAITSIAIAISLFVLPVIYHHLEYPYRDLEKFKKRAHRFLLFGFIPAGVTLYLSLEVAISLLAGEFAFGIAAIPFAFVYILYQKRR